MNNRNICIAAAGLVTVITCAAIYLSTSPAGSQSGSNEASAATGAGQALRTAASQTGGVNGITASDLANIKADKAHASQTAKIDPEKYSSNPPAAPWKKEIISLAYRLDMKDIDKAKQLLSKLESLPPEGQVLAMDYATKFIPDQSYLQMRPWIFQLGKSEELRETILTDALTRGDEVRMPTLVEILRQPDNPAQEEVREILVAYLDHDHGTDVKKWDEAVRKYLVANPGN